MNPAPPVTQTRTPSLLLLLFMLSSITVPTAKLEAA